MQIGHVDITKDVLVIAEIGNNHEGDPALAEELIRLAAKAGAQAVKFQTILPAQLVMPDQTARLEQLQRFHLSAETYRHLAAVAKSCGVMFMSTPFALEAVDQLDSLVPAFKIASGDNNYTALLEKVAQTGKPVVLSTGMSTVDDAKAAVATLESVWRKRQADPGVVLLHCVSAYPTPPQQANLRALTTLARLGRPVGYSDHTLGINAAVAAVGLGARVIEKHFTVSKTKSAFRDHQLSAEPEELRELVARIRDVNQMLGDGVKRVMPDEQAVAQAARRSACAARDLAAGHVLVAEDVVCLRPAGGISPDRVGTLLGRGLTRAVRAGERLSPELVK
jgi:N,N'-diacetyllegionaminate synthase